MVIASASGAISLKHQTHAFRTSWPSGRWGSIMGRVGMEPGSAIGRPTRLPILDRKHPRSPPHSLGGSGELPPRLILGVGVTVDARVIPRVSSTSIWGRKTGTLRIASTVSPHPFVVLQRPWVGITPVWFTPFDLSHDVRTGVAQFLFARFPIEDTSLC